MINQQGHMADAAASPDSQACMLYAAENAKQCFMLCSPMCRAALYYNWTVLFDVCGAHWICERMLSV